MSSLEAATAIIRTAVYGEEVRSAIADGLDECYAEYTEVTDALANKQDALTFDSTPASGSTNPITSGGVYTAINSLKNDIDAAEVMTTSITKAVAANSTVTFKVEAYSLANKPLTISLSGVQLVSGSTWWATADAAHMGDGSRGLQGQIPSSSALFSVTFNNNDIDTKNITFQVKYAMSGYATMTVSHVPGAAGMSAPKESLTLRDSTLGDVTITASQLHDLLALLE